jgi:hypothetical protein
MIVNARRQKMWKKVETESTKIHNSRNDWINISDGPNLQ